jgi:hypothetical protein
MKTLPSLFQNICFGLLVIIGLSSFSTVPAADVRDDNPPVESTKETRRKKRLNKRYNRLHQQFEQSTNTKQRYRLQKKIRTVERLQEDGSPVLGIIGLGLGILSFILLIASFLSLIRAGLNGLNAAATAGPVVVIGLLTAIAGLALSIVYSIMNRKDPERYPFKGFAIAGIIISSVMLGFLIAISMFLFYFANI